MISHAEQKLVCEICTSDRRVQMIPVGGIRPSRNYREPECKMCFQCLEALHSLIESDRIKVQVGSKDTTNSRFSRIKAAIKRQRFGHPNLPVTEVRTKLQDLGLL